MYMKASKRRIFYFCPGPYLKLARLGTLHPAFQSRLWSPRQRSGFSLWMFDRSPNLNFPQSSSRYRTALPLMQHRGKHARMASCSEYLPSPSTNTLVLQGTQLFAIVLTGTIVRLRWECTSLEIRAMYLRNVRQGILAYKVLAGGNQLNSSCWSCMHVMVPSHEHETVRNLKR